MAMKRFFLLLTSIILTNSLYGQKVMLKARVVYRSSWKENYRINVSVHGVGSFLLDGASAGENYEIKNPQSGYNVDITNGLI